MAIFTKEKFRNYKQDKSQKNTTSASFTYALVRSVFSESISSKHVKRSKNKRAMQANTQNKAKKSERNKQLIKQTTKTNVGDNIRVEDPRVVASYL